MLRSPTTEAKAFSSHREGIRQSALLWAVGICLAWLGVVGACEAQAGSLTVMPITVQLSAPTKVREALHVTNNGNEPMRVQVDAVAWAQSNGQDAFVPTPDLLVNPGMFEVQPGQTQVLRMGWRGTPSNREQTYRIILRELPIAALAPMPSVDAPSIATSGMAIKVLLEMRLPVYLAPAKAEGEPEWSARRLDRDSVEVRLDNRANVHTVIDEIRVQGESTDQALAKQGVHAAVLAGQQRRWVLPLAPNASGPLALVVRSDQQTQQIPVGQ